DLKTKKFRAQAALRVTPKPGGTPVSGRIAAKYSGDTVSIDGSQINLPNTRIEASGEIGRLARVTVVSRNLSDLSPALTPTTLQGGPANLTAELRGALTAPTITGNVAASKFIVSGRMFDRLSTAFLASPNQANVSDGIVARGGFEAKFSGSVGLQRWK